MLSAWIWLGVAIGSTVGGLIPELFHVSLFSPWSIVGSTIGGLLGIWAGYVVGNNYS